MGEIWNRCNESSSNAKEKRQEIPDIFEEIESDLYGDDVHEIDMNLVRGETSVIYQVSVKQLARTCVELIEEYDRTRFDVEEYDRTRFNVKKNDKRYLNALISEINVHNADLLYLQDIFAQYDPSKEYFHREYLTFYNLNEMQRWELYFFWVRSFHKELKEEFRKYEAGYRESKNRYDDYRQLQDLALLKRMHVVGMTTTGAARLQTLLRELHPRVVIIEEAAEVLESHVVVSLTKECQHVILIGDHKQLRPSNAVYKLAKDYKMDISLFERMVNNGMDCPRLNVQHRMRPQIARLISPRIYENLENHPSVFSYPDILGVTKNVYFIDHDEPEEEVDDSLSKNNIYEANFMIEFCKYLILQGYEGSRITILTTYTGQMMYLRSLKRNSELLLDVRIIVVDKYQGEENDIILLSLVRSNSESKIGFLKTENRVCVALSRAKYGLYIIGNMSNLTFHENGNLWPNIRSSLEELDAFGKSITLKCQKHNTETVIEKPSDFEKVPLGGCHMPCNELMECGDHCKMVCHRTDPEHKNVKCLEKCRRTCERNHPCKLLCYQKCAPCQVKLDQTLPCGHQHELPCHTDVANAWCKTNVDVVLPYCGHNAKKECSKRIEEVECLEMCKDRLPCGHACVNNCHKTSDPDHKEEYKCMKPCARKNKECSLDDPGHICKNLCSEECKKCTVLVEKELLCGHKRSLRCTVPVEKIKCFKECERMLPCEHGACKLKCWETCVCITLVEKKIEGCGHSVLLPCYKEAKRENCDKMCERILPCSHGCIKRCKDPCDPKTCNTLISFPKTLACGHSAVMPCNRKLEMAAYKPDDERLLELCNQPCNTMLKCDDVCSGTCGTCWQGRLHVVCQNVCGNTLICNHSCKYPCRRMCPPCQEKCTYECVHSKCPKICGEPCVNCMEPCTWGCVHSKCTMRCSDICNREPCYEPCPEKLQCGHDCIGFCGEPCPTLCRVCNEEEVTTIVFGYEDEEDARFVLLVDCNHVIESRALDQFLKMSPEGGEIKMKVCPWPQCRKPILKTLRFMNEVKETYKNIISIKKKNFGNMRDLHRKQQHIENRIRDFNATKLDGLLKEGFVDLRILLKRLFGFLGYKIDKNRLESLSCMMDVIDHITQRLPDIIRVNQSSVAVKKSIKVILNRLFKRLLTYEWITPQVIEDINGEIMRYHRIIDLYLIEIDYKYRQWVNSVDISTKYENIKRFIDNIGPYHVAKDMEIGNLIMELKKTLNSKSGILTDIEKDQIREALDPSYLRGYKQGHWYMCKNGHFYCVTECGAPRESRICPEKGCGARIGVGSDARGANF